MKKNLLQPAHLVAIGFVALGDACALWSQTTPVVPPSGASNGEVIELSPFQVVAEEETGYRATSTLAGTRLKTDLKDIGAAVSVVTDEMMRDLGAVNAEDILVFTAGTEVGGMSGNFRGDGLDRAGNNNESRANPSDNNRVRGLAKITNTRDYFVTDIPFNQYNSTALTISRGPNAILAGAGSPGGVLDRSLKTATFKDRNEVTARLSGPGDVVNISFFDPATNSFRVAPLTIGQIVKSAGMRQGKLESQAISLQSHWWESYLISLVGWRRDSDTNYTAADPVVLPDGNIDPATLRISAGRISVVMRSLATGGISSSVGRSSGRCS